MVARPRAVGRPGGEDGGLSQQTALLLPGAITPVSLALD